MLTADKHRCSDERDFRPGRSKSFKIISKRGLIKGRRAIRESAPPIFDVWRGYRDYSKLNPTAEAFRGACLPSVLPAAASGLMKLKMHFAGGRAIMIISGERKSLARASDFSGDRDFNCFAHRCAANPFRHFCPTPRLARKSKHLAPQFRASLFCIFALL